VSRGCQAHPELTGARDPAGLAAIRRRSRLLAGQEPDVELPAAARVAAIVTSLREVEPDAVDQPTLRLGAKTDQLAVFTDDRLERIEAEPGSPVHVLAGRPGPVAVARVQLPGYIRAVVA